MKEAEEAKYFLRFIGEVTENLLKAPVKQQSQHNRKCAKCVVKMGIGSREDFFCAVRRESTGNYSRIGCDESIRMPFGVCWAAACSMFAKLTTYFDCWIVTIQNNFYFSVASLINWSTCSYENSIILICHETRKKSVIRHSSQEPLKCIKINIKANRQIERTVEPDTEHASNSINLREFLCFLY